MEYITHSPMETQGSVRNILEILAQQRDAKGATVIALEGELGAGKTTFTQGLARELGITAPITSPTFVIMKQYPVRIKNYELRITKLVHIDAYRLNSSNELTALGFNELLSNPENLIVIEWPERVADLLLITKITLHFDHLSELTRKITVRP